MKATTLIVKQPLATKDRHCDRSANTKDTTWPVGGKWRALHTSPGGVLSDDSANAECSLCWEPDMM